LRYYSDCWPEWIREIQYFRVVGHKLCLDCDELIIDHQHGRMHCVCGGEWLGDDCETRAVQAADLEDSRRAAAAKARLEADEITHDRLPAGTTARLRAPMLAFTSLPAHPDQGVDLPAGATCMVLRTILNRSQGSLYMTQALFGARALWVPAHCLEVKK
jgi:hypothetical protein